MSRVGGKRQNERWDQGVSTDAVMRSAQHCGGATTSRPAITLSFKTEAQRGGSLQPRYGAEWNKPVKFDVEDSS